MKKNIGASEIAVGMPSLKSYEKLTPKQKKFFDLYIEARSLVSITKLPDWDTRDVYNVYNSRGIKNALKEHNETLKSTALYDETVIIDKLWKEYSDPDTPKNVKVNILIMLGKHIGMWATTTRNQGTGDVTYNVINYSAVEKPGVSPKEITEEVKTNLPKNIEIVEYNE